jgi:hypothetical protein
MVTARSRFGNKRILFRLHGYPGEMPRIILRSAHSRTAAACLISAAFLAFGLANGAWGSTSALAAASSECEPLPAATSTPSPAATAPAASQAELCVSVQASATSVTSGQAATYSVQVSTQNGPASGVFVTLTAAPAGAAPAFTGRCPGGNGTATCSVGSVGGTVAPSSFQLQAQVKAPSGTTAVTLTATAGAVTSPAMVATPVATGTVQVVAASPSPSKSPSSTPAASTPASATPAQTVTVTPPALASPPPLGAMPSAPGITTPLTSPVSVASDFPVITPTPVTPVVVSPASPVADTGTPVAGNFTVQIGMSAATAQLLGFVLLGLVLLLAATKLVNDQLTARRNQKKRKHAARAAGTGRERTAGSGRFRLPRLMRLMRLTRPGRRRSPAQPGIAGVAGMPGPGTAGMPGAYPGREASMAGPGAPRDQGQTPGPAARDLGGAGIAEG